MVRCEINIIYSDSVSRAKEKPPEAVYTRCLPVRMVVRFILCVTRLSLGNLMPVDGFLRLRDISGDGER